MKNLIILITVFGLTISSCSVVKRKYLPGYSVEWRKSLITLGKMDSEEMKDSDENDSLISILPLNENTEKTNIQIDVNNDVIINGDMDLSDSEACDTIILIDGSIIIAKIIYIDKKVNYRKCGNKNSLYKSAPIYKIAKIKHSDGHIDEFNRVENQITDDPNQPKKKVKTDFMGLFGILIGLLGVMFFLIGVTFLFYGMPVILFYAILLSLALAALIIGIKSINRVNRNPNTYSRNSLSIGVVSILSSAFLLFLGILLFLI